MARSPSRRGQTRATGPQLPAQGDGLTWPGYAQQLQHRGQLPAGEAQAAERRAALLVAEGWGPLRSWLEAPGPHPGERSADLT